MSAPILQQSKSQQRPFSADVNHLTKARLQTSNCPTIIKHEIMNPLDTFQVTSPNGTDKPAFMERPRTATSTKMKFSFLQNMKTATTPGSIRPGSAVNRPMTAMSSTTINFDFLNSIGKTMKGKFQDNSKIKPLKKLKTNQFHSVIFKVKQQKEVLEKEIGRMEQWHRDFKENDIWSTPQNAIVESILRLNAQANPEGNVSRYLQSEREKEESGKLARKYQRPSSSYSTMPKVTPKNAKSVTDFFSPENPYDLAIEEILGANRQQYKSQYNLNKRKITEKMNHYVENMGNYNALVKGQEVDAYGQRQEKRATIHDQSDTIEEQQERSFSDIQEDNEGSDIPSSSNLANLKASPNMRSENIRPVSAQVQFEQISTVFSPKDFQNSAVKARGSPPAIHTRPSTAKLMKTSPTAAISTGLAMNGEIRGQSISSVKFVPIGIEGTKLQVGAEKSLGGKENEYTGSRSNLLSAGSMRKLAKAQEVEFEGMVTRPAGRRITSAKASNKTMIGTQTQTKQFLGGDIYQHGPKGMVLTISPNKGVTNAGMLNIDGEYFDSYHSKRLTAVKGIYGIMTPTQGKSILESWVSRDSHPYA